MESGSRSPCNRKNLQLSESQTFDRFHEFLRRAQKNITTISSLIITLEKSYEYRKEVESQLATIVSRAEFLENQQREATKAFDDLLSEINETSLRLFRGLRFRKDLYTLDTRQELERFSDLLGGAAAQHRIDDRVSPLALYIKGMGHISRYEYTLAIASLKQCLDAGKTQRVTPDLSAFRQYDKERAVQLLESMLDQATYWIGTSYASTGLYQDSINMYQALSAN